MQIFHTLQNIFPPVSYTYNHEVCSSYTQIRKCFVFNVKFSSFLSIFTGNFSCIVKLPREVCASHTKRVGYNKTILQLNKKIYSKVNSVHLREYLLLSSLFPFTFRQNCFNVLITLCVLICRFLLQKK